VLITSPFPIKDDVTVTIPLVEIAQWLALYSGMTLNQASQVEGYIVCLLSKEVHSTAAAQGQQWMKKAM
jgi:hypothetical protein